MVLPIVLDKELADVTVINRGRVAHDNNCQGSIHHSPTPLLLRVVPLNPWGATEKPHVWLCSLCQDNLAVFQHLLDKYDGKIPWVIQRQFGNSIRALGLQGWHIYETTRV